jgi:hypothetical protein
VAWRTRLAVWPLLLAAIAACAHEVVWQGDEPDAIPVAAEPAALTMAVGPGSFEKARLTAAGVTERFARTLRDAGLFQGVMYPVPPGVSPTWEIELTGRDSIHEPDSNFWKAALAAALPPLALVLTLENDYTLELEALVLYERELVVSYRGTAPIRHRYQRYADRRMVDLEGVELAVARATEMILAALARDLERLLEEDRRRASAG